MKTIVSADRTCDLNQDLIDIYNIHTIPYSIELDGEHYYDNVDITLNEIFKAYDEKQILPKTSAINVGEYTDYFMSLANQCSDDCEILHFCLGSALSSSFRNCNLAAEGLEKKGIKVYPVDSCTLSSSIGMQVMDACELLNKGKSPSKIQKHFKKAVHKYHASFVINNLEYLHAGGRCSSLAKFVTSALNIKPSIKVDTKENGAMVVDKKYRGKYEVVVAKYAKDVLAKYEDKIDYSECFITSTTSILDYDERDIIKTIIEEETNFRKCYTSTASCTIGSHCGPGTIGLLLKTK